MIQTSNSEELEREVSADDVNIEDDSVDDEIDESEDVENIEKSSEKDKHSPELRRAIEDHLERTRLQKELDYLFDEDFPEEDDES